MRRHGPALSPERDVDGPRAAIGGSHPFRGSYRELWEASERRRELLEQELLACRSLSESRSPPASATVPTVQNIVLVAVVVLLMAFMAFGAR